MANFQREVAHRLFAAEFNASRHTIQGEGERDASYVVSPLGAKVNRLHVVGVCTDVEAVGEAGDVYRARISDPSGVFTVYAGQYQPEAAQALSEMQPPCFVAVTGKARTYEPEDGSMFCSIRPETVTVLGDEGEGVRDQWILTTAGSTLERLQANVKVQAGSETTDLPSRAADAALLAKETYGWVELPRYWETTRSALDHLVQGSEVPVHQVQQGQQEEHGAAPAAPPTWNPETAPSGAPVAGAPAGGAATAQVDPAKQAAEEELDDAILAMTKKLEGDKGANWDDIVEEATGSGELTADDVDEALNRLMDKGLVYEPTLGILRST
ncbi:MAG: hypothetical protein ACPGQL_04895 [Thermoplasmatota archaeon]